MWGQLSLLDTWTLQGCETLTLSTVTVQNLMDGAAAKNLAVGRIPPVCCVRDHAFRGERSSAARMSRGVISSHSGDRNPCFQRSCQS